MSHKRHRVLKKANRVAKDELDRRFNMMLGDQRKELDAKLAEVNKRYGDALEQAKQTRDKERADAWRAYEEARDKMLKKLAAEEAEKAAA